MPEELTDWPRLEMAPRFFHKFAYRQAHGAVPFSGTSDSASTIYLRYISEDAERMQEPHLIALMDAIPPPALALLDSVIPASALTWTIEMLDNSTDFAFDAWWRYDSVMDAAGEGYTVHSGHVINPAGIVTATIRQIGAVFG